MICKRDFFKWGKFTYYIGEKVGGFIKAIKCEGEAMILQWWGKVIKRV